MLHVAVAIRFTPSELVQAVYQCWEEVPTPLEAGTATVCLTIHKISLDYLGEFPPVDPGPHPTEVPSLSPGQNGPRNPNLTHIPTQLLVSETWVPALPLFAHPDLEVCLQDKSGVCPPLSSCPAAAHSPATCFFPTHTGSCSHSCPCIPRLPATTTTILQRATRVIH